jgi:RHS repeat-associated protein
VGGLKYFYEVDLAGNVRRLRRPDGSDAGGYRYSAFGTQYAGPAPAVDQPLRWKGRWWSDFGGVYDVRARQWSPALGAFTSVDEFQFHDARSTLWGWPNQNPTRYADKTGRCYLCIGALIVGGLIIAGAFLENDTAQNDISPAELATGGVGLSIAAGGAAIGPTVESLFHRALQYLLTAGAKKLGDDLEEGGQCPTANQGVPQLASNNGGRMLGEALGHLKGMPTDQRVAAFRDFAGQITSATSGQWSAQEFQATNATVFAGEGGEALVFDAAGNMFRGQLVDRAAFMILDNGSIEVNFSLLKAIK